MNRLRRTRDLPAIRTAPRLGATRVLIVFDDGFLRSTLATVGIYEAFGWKAVFAVNAEPARTPHARDGAILADWSLWQRLHAAGHHVHAHGLDHANEARQAPGLAIQRLRRCLARFRHRLPGFEPAQTIFHYPYNQGTPVLHRWLLRHAGAVRQGGDGVNRTSDLGHGILHCTAHGPGSCDDHLHQCLDRVAIEQPPLFIYNAHGLDGEGWGPLGSAALRTALARLRR